MKIKICGLNQAENIQDVLHLEPNFIGFIFYKKSPRCVTDLNDTYVQNISSTKKVGVFVNEEIVEVIKTINKYKLDFVQLHGDENMEYCKILNEHKIAIIKAFSINENFNFDKLAVYEKYCSYFLFDTATQHYGGSGKTFDWEILQQYQLQTPFFLSGGIGLENINDALHFQHPQLFAYDLNSKLEDRPGLKNISTTKNIIQKIRNYATI